MISGGCLKRKRGINLAGPSVALLARYPSLSFLIRASYCEMGRAGENGQYILPHNIAHCQQRNIFIAQNCASCWYFWLGFIIKPAWNLVCTILRGWSTNSILVHLWVVGVTNEWFPRHPPWQPHPHKSHVRSAPFNSFSTFIWQFFLVLTNQPTDSQEYMAIMKPHKKLVQKQHFLLVYSPPRKWNMLHFIWFHIFDREGKLQNSQSFFFNIVQRGGWGRTHVNKMLLQILYYSGGYLAIKIDIKRSSGGRIVTNWR